MPRTTVQDGADLRAVPDDAGAANQQPLTAVSAGGFGQMAVMQPAGQLGTRQMIQDELDGIAAAARAFHVKQPDQVMRECAAYTARLTELCVLMHRVESLDRQYLRVRTQQVEKWLTELERQFKIASRLVEVQRQDIALLGGQV